MDKSTSIWQCDIGLSLFQAKKREYKGNYHFWSHPNLTRFFFRFDIGGEKIQLHL